MAGLSWHDPGCSRSLEKLEQSKARPRAGRHSGSQESARRLWPGTWHCRWLACMRVALRRGTPAMDEDGQRRSAGSKAWN